MAGKSPGGAALKADDETLQSLTRFGGAQCPPEEVACALGVELGELERLLATDANARLTYEKAKALGLITLREAQFKLAATSVPMAMMLAKTYLGHDERRESDEAAPFDRAGAAERVRAKLAALAAEGEPRTGLRTGGGSG